MTIDCALLSGWERPIDNINPIAMEILAAVAADRRGPAISRSRTNGAAAG